MENLNLESTDIAAAGSRHVAEMLLENISITHIVGILGQTRDCGTYHIGTTSSFNPLLYNNALKFTFENIMENGANALFFIIFSKVFKTLLKLFLKFMNV